MSNLLRIMSDLRVLLIGLAAIGACASTSTLVAAAETPWQEVAPGAQLRLISAPTGADTAIFGLELKMQPGLKTYWRVPGETGIPTEITAQVGDADRAVTTHWPLPRWDVTEDYVDLVYTGDVTLPFEVENALTGGRVEVSVLMGICSDICVPVMADFTLDDVSATDPGQKLRLRQAMATTPIPWSDTDAPLRDFTIDPETGSLSMRYDPYRVDPSAIFPAFEGAGFAFAPAAPAAGENQLTFELLARHGETRWKGLPVSISFMTADGPYSIVALPENL